MNKKESKKSARRRYYLHSKIRKQYRLNARKRNIQVPREQFENVIPEPFNAYFKELTGDNYSIQSVIE